MKIAADRVPPIDENDLQRVRSIRLPLTIEHPAYTSKWINRGLVQMLEGEEHLKSRRIWGSPPDEESDADS